jgi:hypothetical protein
VRVCAYICIYIVISMNRVRIAHKLQNDLMVLSVQETCYPVGKADFNDGISLFVYFFHLVCEAIGTAATPGLLCQSRVIDLSLCLTN